MVHDLVEVSTKGSGIDSCQLAGGRQELGLGNETATSQRTQLGQRCPVARDDECLASLHRAKDSAAVVAQLALADLEYTLVTPKVYYWCMAKVRTNIEIEDRYVEAVMDRYGVRTKTEAVDLALRHLAGQPMTREEALAMRGAHAISETPTEVTPTPAA